MRACSICHREDAPDGAQVRGPSLRGRAPLAAQWWCRGGCYMRRWAVVAGKVGGDVGDDASRGCGLDGGGCRSAGASGESPAPPWLVPMTAVPAGVVPLLGCVVLGAPALLLSSLALVPPGESSSSWFLPERATVASSSLPPCRRRLWRPWPCQTSFCRVTLPCRRAWQTPWLGHQLMWCAASGSVWKSERWLRILLSWRGVGTGHLGGSVNG